jgi:hypothetical protein
MSGMVVAGSLVFFGESNGKSWSERAPKQDKFHGLSMVRPFKAGAELTLNL